MSSIQNTPAAASPAAVRRSQSTCPDPLLQLPNQDSTLVNDAASAVAVELTPAVERTPAVVVSPQVVHPLFAAKNAENEKKAAEENARFLRELVCVSGSVDVPLRKLVFAAKDIISPDRECMAFQNGQLLLGELQTLMSPRKQPVNGEEPDTSGRLNDFILQQDRAFMTHFVSECLQTFQASDQSYEDLQRLSAAIYRNVMFYVSVEQLMTSESHNSAIRTVVKELQQIMERLRKIVSKERPLITTLFHELVGAFSKNDCDTQLRIGISNMSPSARHLIGQQSGKPREFSLMALATEVAAEAAARQAAEKKVNAANKAVLGRFLKAASEVRGLGKLMEDMFDSGQTTQAMALQPLRESLQQAIDSYTQDPQHAAAFKKARQLEIQESQEAKAKRDARAAERKAAEPVEPSAPKKQKTTAQQKKNNKATK